MVCLQQINFGVGYIDCMTNEYNQTYKIQLKSKKLQDIKLDIGYPTFIGQTYNVGKPL